MKQAPFGRPWAVFDGSKDELLDLSDRIRDRVEQHAKTAPSVSKNGRETSQQRVDVHYL